MRNCTCRIITKGQTERSRNARIKGA